MERGIEKYMRKHTRFVATLLISMFLLLGLGEYYLYRKVMYVSKMMSEGFMQIKERNTSKGQLLMQKGRIMMRRNGDTKPLDMNLMMPNGTRVMMDGQIVRPDGTKMKLQENQMMELE